MLVFFFFFQAEDGIRDHCVTGVQTCALPISRSLVVACGQIRFPPERPMRGTMMDFPLTLPTILERSGKIRSEERRVGKECRYRCQPYHQKNKWISNEYEYTIIN